MPLACRGDVSLHLFAVNERFSLLRRLAVESVYLAHQGRHSDFSLLLELGVLATNRLIALAEALAEGRCSRQGFFELMRSQVESHREMDATWRERTSGVQALIAAQSKFDSLAHSAPHATGEAELGRAWHCAADCAVYIGFFLEAWWRRHEQAEESRSRR
jgi:hypothetical protein